jgi:hypothetical protein
VQYSIYTVDKLVYDFGIEILIVLKEKITDFWDVTRWTYVTCTVCYMNLASSYVLYYDEIFIRSNLSSTAT